MMAGACGAIRAPAIIEISVVIGVRHLRNCFCSSYKDQDQIVTVFKPDVSNPLLAAASTAGHLMPVTDEAIVWRANA